MSNSLMINLIKTNDCLGVPFYSGSMKFKDLVKNFTVPKYLPGTSVADKDSGYQRLPSASRVEAVKNRVLDKSKMTQPFIDNVNLNIRSRQVLSYVKPVHAGKDSHGDFFTFEFIDNLGKFFIVDGQTRILGAAQAYESAKQTNDGFLANLIGNINVQFTLSFTEDVFKESYVFYLINQHSKRIPPEGAYTLIKNGYENNNVDFETEIEELGKQSDVYAGKIADRLNRESEVWAGKMRDFNESGSKVTILAVSKMIAPLYKIQADTLSDEDSSVRAMDSSYKILEAYWTAFKEIFPRMFNPITSENYNVFKAGPAEIMTKVLIMLVNKAKAESTSGKAPNLTDPTYYKGHLNNLRDLQDYNSVGEGEKVTGESIFKIGKAGSIGRYSNNAAKTEMAKKMYEKIFPLPSSK